MLPKERIIAALNRKKVDRTPVGEIGVDYTITEEALGRSTLYRAKWKEYCALWEGRRDEYVDSCKRDIVDLVRKFEWDFVPVFLVPPKGFIPEKPEFLSEYKWRVSDGRIYQYDPVIQGHAIPIYFPPVTEEDIKDIPLHIDESQLELVKHVVNELGDTHFIIGRFNEYTGTFPATKYGFETLFIYMIDNPALVKKIISAESKRGIEIAKVLLDAGCDGILPDDDYCGNDGPFMSPDMFKEFIYPWLQKFCKTTHERGKYLIKHTHGKTWTIMDLMMEAGIDGWHGIQPSIGMTIQALKETYDDKICFFGGVDCSTLVDGNPDDVREEVRRALQGEHSSRGLVLTSSNTLMVGAKYENYLAMLNEARRLDVS